MNIKTAAKQQLKQVWFYFILRTTWLGYAGATTNPFRLIWIPKQNPYLNQTNQKNTCQTALPKLDSLVACGKVRDLLLTANNEDWDLEWRLRQTANEFVPRHHVFLNLHFTVNKTLWEGVFGRGRTTGMILWTCLIAAKELSSYLTREDKSFTPLVCWTTQLIQYVPIHNKNYSVISWQCLKICTSPM